MMPESAAPLAAALAGRYTIARELGRAGMATVYLAKELRPRLPNPDGQPPTPMIDLLARANA